MIKASDFDIKIREAVLSNGTPIILFQKKGMPIYTEVRFSSGSRFDPPGKEGLAHFVEHMMLAGSTKFPSKDKLAVHIEQLGGIFGASTSADEINVYVEVAEKEDFSKGVLLLREILTEACFKDETIEIERETIFKEIGDKVYNPAKQLHNLYYKLFFQATERGRGVLGNKKTVSIITQEELTDYYKNMLVSNRAVIGVCGDIQLEQVIRELEEGLKLRATTTDYKMKGDLPVIRDKRILIHQYPGQDQVRLLIGFRTCEARNPDTLSLKILATIFARGRASVLSRKLRYEKGLAYTIGINSPNLTDSGTWVIQTSTSKEKVQEVLDIITDEFARIAEGKITEEELSFAKAKIIKSTKIQMQTSASWVKEHISKKLSGNPVKLPDYLNSINTVSLEDLSRVGKKYFKKSSWYLAMCGDIDEESISVNY